MRIAALLLAAGSGRRFGADTPKQFARLGGRAIIHHAAECLLPHVSVLQPVGDAALLDPALAGLDAAGVAIRPAVPGGATRQASVRAGLEALDALPAAMRPQLVLVHDGARPFVPDAMVRGVIDALAHHPGAIPAVAVADTLKHGRDGLVAGTVPRDGLYRAQTPQGFHFALLRDLHRDTAAGGDMTDAVAGGDLTDAVAGGDLTDDAALLERAGHAVALVPGSDDNIKLTHREDLVRLERLIGPSRLPRIGTGFDVHAFADDRALVLCGITVPFERGLAGHSDADVGIHALCDAIYGALAEGDIGRHFPPGEEEWRDADSARFLIHAGERIAARGGLLVNADVTLICERPKIGPHATEMRHRLAGLLRVEPERISVKATTTERLGFTGRGEGIAAMASVSLMVP